MENNNDELLRHYFKEQMQEIPDKGFSRKVLRRLPDKRHSLLHFFDTILVILCVTLFIFFDGIQLCVDILRNIFVTLIQKAVLYIDWHSFILSLALMIVVLLGFIIYRAYRSFDL
jgi:hypothetical protein